MHKKIHYGPMVAVNFCADYSSPSQEQEIFYSRNDAADRSNIKTSERTLLLKGALKILKLLACSVAELKKLYYWEYYGTDIHISGFCIPNIHPWYSC